MGIILSLLVLPFLSLWLFVIWWLIKPKYFPFTKQNRIPNRLMVLGIASIIYIVLFVSMGYTIETSQLPEENTSNFLEVAAFFASIVLLILLGFWCKYVADKRKGFTQKQLSTQAPPQPTPAKSLTSTTSVDNGEYISNLHIDLLTKASFETSTNIEQSPIEPINAQAINNQAIDDISYNQKHQLIVEIAQLIATLHQQGRCHGDINPNAILMDNYSLSDADTKHNPPDLLMTNLTLAEPINSRAHQTLDTREVVGSPAYLAPECWQGQNPTRQSDVYAFGILMYEILMGKPPFMVSSQSRSQMDDWAIEHCHKSVPILTAPYERYQTIIDKSLAKQAKDRYQSMETVALDLRNVQLVARRNL